MSCTKEIIRDINDILESISKIERQVELIKQGKTEVGETGVNRLDVIKEKTSLIRIILKRIYSFENKENKQNKQFSDAMRWASNIGGWYSEVRKENPGLTDDEIVKIVERKYPYPD